MNKPHWSFWVIGALALLWHGMSIMNFVMQLDPETVATMPENYQAIVESRPAWATAAFGIAAFGGAIGSLLLLLRNRAASRLFVVSLVAALAQGVPMLGVAAPAALVGFGSFLVVAAFLIWYSRRALAPA